MRKARGRDGAAAAKEGLLPIAKLRETEQKARGLPPGGRLAVRKARAMPLAAVLPAWPRKRMKPHAPKPALAGSPPASAAAGKACRLS